MKKINKVVIIFFAINLIRSSSFPITINSNFPSVVVLICILEKPEESKGILIISPIS